MKKIYTYLSTIIVLALLAIQVSSAEVSVFVREGDEFTYTVNTLMVRETINGTVENEFFRYENGTTISIIIDEVTEDETAGTYVNYTATYDEQTSSESTFANDFRDYFYGYLFLAIFKAFGYPNFASFDTIYEDKEDITYFDIPFIVTDNGTYFRDLKGDLVDLEESVNGEELTFDSNVNYFSEEELFEMDMLMDFSDSEANNSNGEEADLNIRYENVLKADVSTSVITEYFLSLRHELIIGDSEAVLEVLIDFEQGGSLLDNIEVNAPLFGALLGLSGIVALIRLNQRRKRSLRLY